MFKAHNQTNVVVIIDTLITCKIPILNIDSSSLLIHIADTVLDEKLHERNYYKDNIFTINIEKNAWWKDSCHVFFVNLSYKKYALERTITGLFKYHGQTFICSIDSIYSKEYDISSNYEIITYKKDVAYIIDGIRHNSDIPPFYDPPLWIFTNKSQGLSLFRKDFIPPPDITK